MRCDLHVHTTKSGMCTVPGLSRYCFESYNEPLALYARLKQRGMDLVTVTDHDSIAAVEELRHFPDFFLSEEVTCTMPSGTEMHAGVYGMQESDHEELQRRRHDVESLLAYAAEHNLFVTVNHLYSSLTGSRKDEDYAIFARDFHGVETLNGMMLPRSNRLAADFARRYNKPALGGSDAHALHAAARTWTEVPGAAGIEDFLAGMRRGHTVPGGESGDYWKLTATVCDIGLSFLRANPMARPAAAIMALAPVITLGNYLREVGFAWYWGQRNNSAAPAAAVTENGI